MKQISQLVRRQIAQDERIARGIGADVLPRIRTIERETARVVNRDIPNVRARERALAREIDHLWTWTRRHSLVAGTTAFAGAVAWALAKLGAGWVRCPTARDFFKRRGCNAWNELEAVLALGAVIGGVSLVELAREEQRVIHAVSTAVRDVLEV